MNLTGCGKSPPAPQAVARDARDMRERQRRGPIGFPPRLAHPASHARLSWRCSPAVPDVQAIEVLLCRNGFPVDARVRASRAIEGMVDADGAKQCNAIHPVAGVFCQRVLAESALRIGPLVDQSMPAFIGPGAGAESNVAEVGGHEKVIIQNSSVRTMG